MSGPPPLQYLTADQVWAMNAAILQREGQVGLLHNRAALESAVTRPQMAAHYEQADLIAQAATLIAGIALAHAFLDGNKRTAAMAGATFLRLNGYQIADHHAAFGQAIETLVVAHAGGGRGSAAPDAETVLLAWLRAHVVPL
jgi:death on curing protein